MGDQLEARTNTIKHIQEEFRHDVREIKGQLHKLTKLVEEHTGIMLENTHGSSSLSLQPTLHPFVHYPHPSHEPYISIASSISLKVYHPNLQPHAPILAIIPTFIEVPPTH